VASESNLAVQTGNEGVVITGTIKYGQPAWELLPILMPSSYTQCGDIKILGACLDKGGDYFIQNVDNKVKFTGMNKHGVTFYPGVYHFDVMHFEEGFTFNVGTGEGIVEIYVGDSVIFDNNSESLPINVATGDTTHLRIYYNGTNTVDLSNNVIFYGFIYAPNALIEVKNNDFVFGNLVGNEVKLWNNAAVHYDKALGTQDFGTVLAAPKPPPENTDWKEIIKTQ
jgi:hypothetical protein